MFEHPLEQNPQNRHIPDEVRELVYRNQSNPVAAIKNGVIADINDMWVQTFGYDGRASLMGTHMSDLLSEESFAKAVARLECKAAGQPLSMNYVYDVVAADGRRLNVEIVSILWPWDRDIVIAIAADVTERERNMLTLKESERLYRTVAETIPCAVLLSDRDGTFIYANERFTDLTGYTMQEMPQVWGLIHPDDGATREEHNRSFVEGTASHDIESRLVCKDGAVIWVSASWEPIVSPSGVLQGFCGTFVDITERRRMEDALRASEAKFRTIYDTANAIILAHDLEWRVVYMNPHACRVLGYEVGEMLGKDIRTMIERDECDRAEPVRQAVSAHPDTHVEGFEQYYLKRDGGRVPISWSVTSLRDAGGNTVGIIGVGQDITRRKQAERALQESERQYRMLVNNLPGAVYRCACDPDWTVEFISDAIEDITGYSAVDFVGNKVRTFNSVIHPLDRRLVLDVITSAIARREPYEVEYRVIGKNGGVRWVHERGQAAPGVNDGAGLIDGVIFDVTDRKAAEEAARTAEERYRLLAETASDILWQMDASSRFIYASPAVRRFGYTPEEWIGHSMVEFLPAHEREAFLRRFADDARSPGPKRFESQLLRKDGSMVWMDISLDYVVVDGSTVRVQGIARDISERKRAEQALRASEGRYRSIVESTQDVIVLNRPDGVISYISPACEAMLGYRPEDLIGTRPSTVHPDDLRAVEGHFRRAVRGERGTNVEYRMIARDGSIRWVSHSWSPVYQSDRLETVVSVIRDITQRRQMEEVQRRAHEDLEKAYNLQREFLNSVTHEVRTPLTAVRGYVEMLLEGVVGPLSDEQTALLQKVLASSQNLLDIVASVLEIARLRSGTVALRPKACKPCLLVEHAVSNIAAQARKKGIQVDVSIRGKDRMGMYDEEKLTIILNNLLSNAVKFTEKGRIGVMAVCTKEGFEVVVEDTGIGIRRRDLGTIFDEFRQLEYPWKHKASGFGLGLAIVANTVDSIGASLAVTSSKGLGSAFTVFVPALNECGGA